MKGKFIVVICALTFYSTVLTTVHTKEMKKVHDKEFSTNMFLSDNIASIQFYAHKVEEQEKIKKAKEEEERKQKLLELEEDKEVEETKKEVTVNKTLRLANHNDSRHEMIRKINRFWSGHGLSGQGESAVDAGIKYNIDPYVIAAISMTESTGGDFNAGSHNAWGRKAVGGGWCNWDSWSDGIYNQSAYLSHMYLDNGVDNLTSIAKIYCPPTYINWAAEVRQYQQEIQNK